MTCSECPRRSTLSLHPEAAKRWRAYAQDEVENNLRKGAWLAGVPAAASKSIEKVLRIAASIHDFSGNSSDEITLAELESAIQIARWCLSEWLRILGPVQEEPEEIQYAREIFTTLQAHLQWGRPDLIQQAFIQPRVRGTARRQPYFDMGLDVLVAHNVVWRELSLGRTRPTKWLRLNRHQLLASGW